MLSKVALTDFAESDSAGLITTTALSFFAMTVVIFLVDLHEASVMNIKAMNRMSLMFCLFYSGMTKSTRISSSLTDLIR
jgi:hypothetical protein